MDSLGLLSLLFLTGLTAGFVDTLAGGGGLITIPVLLNCGLSPQDALGTNKLQASCGSGSATWHFARAGFVDLKECRLGVLYTVVGALAGAFLVRQISPGFLRQAIPALLLGIALYMLVQPRLGYDPRPARMSVPAFSALFGLLIGFYDGFFGPGTGSFWALAYMLALGYTLSRATTHTKVMNFASNLAALAVFLAGGNVQFVAGAVMGVGQLLGARLASRVVIRRGTAFIRPVFITVVIILTAKLAWENWFRR